MSGMKIKIKNELVSGGAFVCVPHQMTVGMPILTVTSEIVPMCLNPAFRVRDPSNGSYKVQ
jgi:hypothetical protein